jgi:DNA-3-methyladenine glycosylase II
MSEGDKHLRKVSPALKGLIDDRGPITPETDRRGSRPNAYEALARAIVGQQLSTKAAASIWGKVTALYGGETPAPEQVLDTDPQELRDAGLSWGKVNYFRDLAEHIADGEVIEELTAIKGIGVWTAHMFLIFSLGRPDILPTGDLGVRRGAQLAHGMEELPEPQELEEMAEKWRPHRTLASLYLWRSLHNEPVSE